MLWTHARISLSLKDKIIAKIIRKYDGELITKNDPFYSLCKSIVGQQVSVASAEAVWRRLNIKIKQITPKNIRNLSDKELTSCGFSRQKITYIKELANNFINKIVK